MLRYWRHWQTRAIVCEFWHSIRSKWKAPDLSDKVSHTDRSGKAIRRGSFGSVKQLIKRIDQFVSHYTENCKPSADSILAKLQRLCTRISGTEHWQNTTAPLSKLPHSLGRSKICLQHDVLL